MPNPAANSLGVGTYGYRAPEAEPESGLRHEYTALLDLRAIGCIIIISLMNFNLFDNVHPIRFEQEDDDVPIIENHAVASYSAELRNLVDQSVQFLPSDRIPPQ